MRFVLYPHFGARSGAPVKLLGSLLLYNLLGVTRREGACAMAGAQITVGLMTILEALGAVFGLWPAFARPDTSRTDSA